MSEPRKNRSQTSDLFAFIDRMSGIFWGGWPLKCAPAPYPAGDVKQEEEEADLYANLSLKVPEMPPFL